MGDGLAAGAFARQGCLCRTPAVPTAPVPSVRAAPAATEPPNPAPRGGTVRTGTSGGRQHWAGEDPSGPGGSGGGGAGGAEARTARGGAGARTAGAGARTPLPSGEFRPP